MKSIIYLCICLGSCVIGWVLFAVLVTWNRITVNQYCPGQCFRVEYELAGGKSYSRTLKILETQEEHITQMVEATIIGPDTIKCRVHFNNFGGTIFHTHNPLIFNEITVSEFDSIVIATRRWRPYPVYNGRDRRREKK